MMIRTPMNLYGFRALWSEIQCFYIAFEQEDEKPKAKRTRKTLGTAKLLDASDSGTYEYGFDEALNLAWRLNLIKPKKQQRKELSLALREPDNALPDAFMIADWCGGERGLASAGLAWHLPTSGAHAVGSPGG